LETLALNAAGRTNYLGYLCVYAPSRSFTTNANALATMPSSEASLDAASVHQTVDKLIENLVSIQDEDGKFLLHLDDGRVIDTKGWNGWEWTHGVGLYEI
jgi:rhamnogalacturonyl hydrolase YesR